MRCISVASGSESVMTTPAGLPPARTAAMHHYQAFLEETRDDELVPEAVRRLADLHLEQEQEQLLQALAQETQIDVAQGVEQGLALDEARGGCREVHRVRREPLFGNLERESGSGRRLHEEIDDGETPQSRHLLDGPLRDLDAAFPGNVYLAAQHLYRGDDARRLLQAG